MECFSLSRGGSSLCELYHLGFRGTHFQFFIQPDSWEKIVERAKEGTFFASNHGDAFVPPTENGNPWGFEACSEISCLLNGGISIDIPAVPSGESERSTHSEMNVYGKTMSVVFFLLSVLLDEQAECGESDLPQLFHADTIVQKGLHGGAFDLTVSLQARERLHAIGEHIVLEKAVEAMVAHYSTMSSEDGLREVHPSNFRARLREKGLLDLNTLGNCACVGASPDSFRDSEGHYLSSHNVDTVSQQFNLLVGISSVWQLVRGVHL